MSDNENDEENGKLFCIERAKQGRAACKKCKEKCLSGELRLAKLVYNPFGSGKLKQWHHVSCLFEIFLNQRLTTKRIEDSDDIDGWDNLEEADQEEILKQIEDCEKNLAKKHGTKFTPKKKEPKPKTTLAKNTSRKEKTSTSDNNTDQTQIPKDHKDNLFREFRRLVADVTNENSYLEKSAIIKTRFTKGADGNGFKGDIVQWCRLLLPSVIKRIYNLQSRQLVKLFSNIFGTNREDMAEHLEQGDIGETIQHFFENSNKIQPSKKSLLTMQEVDDFLEELSKRTREEEQMDIFKKITKKCTGNDLKTIIRLIKHDLRMNAGAKHVLDAVHPDAYEAFQASRDLPSVLKRIMGNKDCLSSSADKSVKATINVMTAVLPMLAEACKSIEQAMKKCPNGMYSEIKYDGERVQVHKQGSEFKYFSRSLKPVMAHKVNHFKDYIPQAFPHAKDLILDSEVLLIDTKTGKPLPFGSLGVHKREEFKDANVCLFVFDCIFYNGESLMHTPMQERRRILHENMTEIPNHIMFSEMEEVHKAADLAAMITKVLKEGLEGLVLKDLMSIYEPGKRHWLKVKKDYLCDGAMADTADLIVLGAWFGTGKKGGMMSIFLMGCYDKYTQKYCTVTKVHTGHDDKRLEQLQTELDMIKISSEVSKVPDWLKCTRTMVPDFVARDPKKQPVWEITGAEFTQHDVHTADGISIRFPRVTRIRDDKDWQTATNLQELKELVKKSKENTDFSLLTKTEIKSEDSPGPSKKGLKKIDTFIVKKEKDIKMEPDIKTESDIKQEKEEEEYEEEAKTGKRKSDNYDIKPIKKIKRSESSKDLLANVKIENDDDSKMKYPVIFRNIKLLALDEVKQDHEDILRHFVAVGGDLIMADECEQATHVAHVIDNVNDISGDYPRQARHITVDWIRDSIGNNEIQDTRPYAVQWIPT